MRFRKTVLILQFVFCHRAGMYIWVDPFSSWWCFTNVWRALQNNLSKFVYWRSISDENFKLKLGTCAQSMALGTRTKFQLEFLIINTIFGFVYFREINLESSRNYSETTRWCVWVETSHYDDVIMGAMASQITSLTIVYSTVYSGADQSQHQAPRHWPLCGEFPAQMASNAEKFPFDDVIMLRDEIPSKILLNTKTRSSITSFSNY